MGNIRSIIAGVALLLSGTAGVAAADLGLPPPSMEMPAPCCGGPWYLKGIIGMTNPQVGDIFTEDFKFNDFTVFHHNIKSGPLFGGGVGYDFNKWLRFDVTGGYRGRSTFFGQDKYPGSNGFNIVGPPGFNPGTGTNIRRTSRAGSDWSPTISSSAPGLASRLTSAAALVSPTYPCWA